MSKLSLKVLLGVFATWLFVITSSISFANPFEDLKLRNYGSFLYTERVPNALFFFYDIEKNDSFELRKALRNHDIDSIVLASPGGSVWEGLNMAGIIFDKKLNTYVPKDGNCASACSFMFFAGNQRKVDGDLGVHQFFSLDGKAKENVQETQQVAQFTVSEIIGFLNEFGTPPFVYERMFQQAEMYYFYADELRQLVTQDNEQQVTFSKKVETFMVDFDKAVETFEASKKKAKKKIETSKVEKPVKTEPKIEPPKAEPKVVPVDEKQILISIQKQLNKLGCDAGPADGVLGNKTKLALKRFAKANKFYVNTNQLNPANFITKFKTAKGKCPIVDKNQIVCDKRIVHDSNKHPLDVNRVTIMPYRSHQKMKNICKRGNLSGGGTFKFEFCSSSKCETIILSKGHSYSESNCASDCVHFDDNKNTWRTYFCKSYIGISKQRIFKPTQRIQLDNCR